MEPTGCSCGYGLNCYGAARRWPPLPPSVRGPDSFELGPVGTLSGGRHWTARAVQCLGRSSRRRWPPPPPTIRSPDGFGLGSGSACRARFRTPPASRAGRSAAVPVKARACRRSRRVAAAGLAPNFGGAVRARRGGRRLAREAAPPFRGAATPPRRSARAFSQPLSGACARVPAAAPPTHAEVCCRSRRARSHRRPLAAKFGPPAAGLGVALGACRARSGGGSRVTGGCGAPLARASRSVGCTLCVPVKKWRTE